MPAELVLRHAEAVFEQLERPDAELTGYAHGGRRSGLPCGVCWALSGTWPRGSVLRVRAGSLVTTPSPGSRPATAAFPAFGHVGGITGTYVDVTGGMFPG